jgi:hypothetical protein
MESGELEARVKMLERTVDSLQADITIAKDIEAIKKLQRSYCYYLEHWEEDEIIALFSHHPEVSAEINNSGEYKGFAAVAQSYRFSDHYTAYSVKRTPPEHLHILMPIAGIVDVDPDGKKAKGRWYGFFIGAMPRPKELRAFIGATIWENEYIKEDGTWKILKLFASDIICSPLDEGWVKNPFVNNPPAKNRPAPVRGGDWAPYPSGYVFPYHYKNPGMGK